LLADVQDEEQGDDATGQYDGAKREHRQCAEEVGKGDCRDPKQDGKDSEQSG
jgi:hypothetical protein